MSGVERMRALAAEAPEDQSSQWYEQLYAEAHAELVDVPWDHREPTPYLVTWLRGRFPAGRGHGRAIVIGCAYGDDAELVASYGFDVAAFDISATAVNAAGERHPRSSVDYRRADLLDLPVGWQRAFDLVIECTTLQSMPPQFHAQAAAAVAALIAPAGQALVIARCPSAGDPPGPPWLPDEREVRGVARDGVRLARLRRIAMRGGDRWVGEFGRPAGG